MITQYNLKLGCILDP